MKKIFFLIAAIATISVHAQTADEVIQKFSDNLGGLEATNKITSAKLTGTLNVQGMELPVTTQILNGKGLRVDVDAMGQSVVNVYYNGAGWKINPFAGAPDVTDVTGSELAEFKSQASLASPLMDYKARGYEVKMAGEEDVDGVKTFKLILNNKDEGKETTYFISSKDYSLVKSISSREIQGQEVEVSTYYSDYKEFGGLKISMTKRLEIDGQEFQSVVLSSVEINVPVDEKIFAKQ